MKTSESITNISKAIVAAWREMTNLQMDANNPYFKSKYTSFPVITEEQKPVLAKHGLALLQPPIGNNNYVGIEQILLHESGEWISQEVMVQVPGDTKNLIQTAGQYISYLKRYSAPSLFFQASDDDLDGNTPSQEGKRAMAAEQRRQVSTTNIQVDDSEISVPPAEKVRITLREIADSFGKIANEKQRNLVSMLLHDILPDKEIRHAVCKEIFQVNQWSDVPSDLVWAMLDWMKPTRNQDGVYTISEKAIQALSVAAQSLTR